MPINCPLRHYLHPATPITALSCIETISISIMTSPSQSELYFLISKYTDFSGLSFSNLSLLCKRANLWFQAFVYGKIYFIAQYRVNFGNHSVCARKEMHTLQFSYVVFYSYKLGQVCWSRCSNLYLYECPPSVTKKNVLKLPSMTVASLFPTDIPSTFCIHIRKVKTILLYYCVLFWVFLRVQSEMWISG